MMRGDPGRCGRAERIPADTTISGMKTNMKQEITDVLALTPRQQRLLSWHSVHNILGVVNGSSAKPREGRPIIW